MRLQNKMMYPPSSTLSEEMWSSRPQFSYIEAMFFFPQFIYGLAREDVCLPFCLKRPQTASIGSSGTFSRQDWIHDPSWICSETTLLPIQGGPNTGGWWRWEVLTLGCASFLCWLLAPTTQEHPASGNNSGLKTISHFSLPLENQGSLFFPKLRKKSILTY